MTILQLQTLQNILFAYSWGRWTESIQQNDFRDGWKESDVEDLARVIVSRDFQSLRKWLPNCGP